MILKFKHGHVLDLEFPGTIFCESTSITLTNFYFCTYIDVCLDFFLSNVTEDYVWNLSFIE